jgi:hypothetical protein
VGSEVVVQSIAPTCGLIMKLRSNIQSSFMSIMCCCCTGTGCWAWTCHGTSWLGRCLMKVTACALCNAFAAAAAAAAAVGFIGMGCWAWTCQGTSWLGRCQLD